MGLISCQTTPLVINSLGGEDTHTHIYVRTQKLKKPGTMASVPILIKPKNGKNVGSKN